jgi:hypothetical protein
VMKTTFIIICLIFLSEGNKVSAQKKFFTRSGKIVFYSKAPIEDIKAVNNQVSCIYEIESNRLVANVLIKAFEFEKALMQQHFNENYLESDKFPKATFKGKLLDIQNINFDTNWSKNIDFEGDLTIHGITKDMKSNATINFTDGTLTVSTEFYVLLKDYNIKIPSTVINNIAEKIQVKVNLKLSELKN